MRWTYALSGLLIDSEVELTTLSPSASDPPEGTGRVRFSLCPPLPEPERWLVVRTLKGAQGPWLSVAQSPRGYLLRLHGFGDFELDPKGGVIRCHPDEHCDADSLEHQLAVQVIPQLLHLRGQPSFHGSAVAHEGLGALAFLGPSGSGKSTLAASFRPPFRFLCDDCLALRIDRDSVFALAGEPSVRLWQDSAASLVEDAEVLQPVCPGADKLRARLPHSLEPQELRGLFVLEPRDGPLELQALSRRDGLVAIAPYLDRLDPSSRVRLARELDLLEQLAGLVPVTMLRFAHRYDSLGEVHRAVLSRLGR